MLDLYHRTSEQTAELIYATGRMLSQENTAEAYFSTRRDGPAALGYGEAVVHVRVPDELAELEDEFPDGEQHYRVSIDALRPEHFVTDRAAGHDRSGTAAQLAAQSFPGSMRTVRPQSQSQQPPAPAYRSAPPGLSL